VYNGTVNRLPVSKQAQIISRLVEGNSLRATARTLTTDGHRVYLNAVENAFGGDVDYAMLVKLYGERRGVRNAVHPLQSALDAKRLGLPGDRIRSTFRPVTWSART
jgi:hypothetical protein